MRSASLRVLALLSLGKLCQTLNSEHELDDDHGIVVNQNGDVSAMSDIRTGKSPQETQHTVIIAPKCWKAATRVLLELTSSFSSDSTALCQTMTENHQKFLALEIAKCHLNDMGLDLYQDTDFVQKHCRAITASRNDWESLFGCLKSLSPAGVNAYTHYVSHVQMLCTRLTRDVVASYQQETYEHLMRQFHDMSQRSVTQIDTIRRWMDDVALQMGALVDLPTQLRDEVGQELLTVWNNSVHEMARGLEDSLQNRLNDQLQFGITQILQSLSNQHHSHWEQLLTQMSRHENEQELRHREWISQQAQLLDSQSQEIAEQLKALDYQRESIANMTAFVLDTTQKIKPLSSLEYVIRFIRDGYGWITTGLFSFFSRNVMWLLTSPSITRGVRPYVLSLMWIELSLEIFFRLRPSSNENHQNILHDIRVIYAFLSVITFILGTLLSISRYILRKKQPFQERESNETRAPVPETPHYGTTSVQPAVQPTHPAHYPFQRCIPEPVNAFYTHGNFGETAAPPMVSYRGLHAVHPQTSQKEIYQGVNNGAPISQTFVPQYAPVPYHRSLVQFQPMSQAVSTLHGPLPRYGQQEGMLAAPGRAPSVTPTASETPSVENHVPVNTALQIFTGSIEEPQERTDAMKIDDTNDAEMATQASKAGLKNSRKRVRSSLDKRNKDISEQKKPRRA